MAGGVTVSRSAREKHSPSRRLAARAAAGREQTCVERLWRRLEETEDKGGTDVASLVPRRL